MVWGALVARGQHFSRHGSAAHTEWHVLNSKPWCRCETYLQIWQTQTALRNYTFFSWSNCYSWEKILTFSGTNFSADERKLGRFSVFLQPSNRSNQRNHLSWQICPTAAWAAGLVSACWWSVLGLCWQLQWDPPWGLWFSRTQRKQDQAGMWQQTVSEAIEGKTSHLLPQTP